MKVSRLFFGLCLVAIFACNAESEDPFVDPILEKFNQDIQAIDAYLATEGISAQIDDNSGIRYVINDQGTGLQPLIADSLTLTYTNSLLETGDIVEEVINQKIRSSLLLDGIAISSTFLQEGGSITAYIPSVYAYGSSGNADIPENSIIISELDLITLHNKQLRSDILTIDDSLMIADTAAIVHPTGIRYFISQGNGASPSNTSNVNINFSGEFFNGTNSGIIFDQAQNVNFNLQNLIIGWQVMIPEMRVGGELTMILPSSFAYGVRGNEFARPSIGANEILVFNVELLSIN